MGKRCGIYLITHKETGRKYVGQSINIDQRWRDHANEKTGCGILAGVIKKHGWLAFHPEVLELCEVEMLNEKEIAWIKRLDSMHPAGFNLTSGGLQYRVTDHVRAVISERTRAGLTPEVIAARAAKIRGVPKSVEHRAKMSAAAKRNPTNIARITEMARNQSAETREKNAASKRGLRATDETRAKISASKTGKKIGPWSADMRAKMSAALKAGWAKRRERLAAEGSK